MKSENILFVDTITKKAGMTISRGGKLFTAHFGERHQYSRDLIRVFDTVLKKARLKPANLAGVVVLVGPGSYTSIRIGVSFANALGFAQNVPVAAKTLFEALPHGSKETVLLEAGRGNIFYHKASKEGVWTNADLAKKTGEFVGLELSEETLAQFSKKPKEATLDIAAVLSDVKWPKKFAPVAAHYILPPNIMVKKK